MKTVIVAGGAGFIGANLCHQLLDAGEKVVCIDNLCTGRMENIESLRDASGFAFLQYDVENPLINHDTLDALTQGKVDEIYNLASPAGPIYYQKNPIKTIRTNVIGTMNLLELALLKQAKFLQASTSEVYGDPLVHPQTEDYWGNVNTIGIRACYDEAKRCAEAACVEYSRVHGVKVKIVRIFNTYGPGMDPSDGRAVPTFITQALLGEPLTVYGTGNHTRSFCSVDDLVEGLLRMMASNDAVIGPINLGNPEEHSIMDLAGSIMEIVGVTTKIEYRDLPMDDPKKRRPDITRAEEVLGWVPTIPLRKGLQLTIESMKAEILASNTKCI